jgi:malonate-semialdehyde dehydrogenase (acetylating)/methylmalonate-semialdehyde dehydrogenase
MQTTPTEPTQAFGKYGQVDNYIGGKFVKGSQGLGIRVKSPLDGSSLAGISYASKADLDLAVFAAQKAFPGWSRTPIKERVQVFFRY